MKERKEKEIGKTATREADAENDKLKIELKTKEGEIKKLKKTTSKEYRDRPVDRHWQNNGADPKTPKNHTQEP